jgi:hypothetical protein
VHTCTMPRARGGGWRAIRPARCVGSKFRFKLGRRGQPGKRRAQPIHVVPQDRERLWTRVPRRSCRSRDFRFGLTGSGACRVTRLAMSFMSHRCERILLQISHRPGTKRSSIVYSLANGACKSEQPPAHRWIFSGVGARA